MQFPVLPEMMYKWNVIRTNSDRCSLIKGQGQLSANLSGQLELAGEGEGMENDE